MIIKRIIWLKQFVDKIARKHAVSEYEVEEVLATQPPVRRMKRGKVEGEDLYRAIGQTDAGRYLTVFFIYKGQGRGLIISARDSKIEELKNYGKKKR
jgi:uncharacterized DUF497 family protein